MDNTVFKLVIKLTKSEKNYFVKFLKNKDISEPFYFQLYNNILKKGVISVDDLSNDINQKVNLKNFSVEKKLLLEKVLISLTNYNFENSHLCIVQKDIHFIQILIEKELYSKAQKYLINAKKIAYLFEEFELLLQLITIEISLCFKNCFIVNYSKLKELYNEQNKVIKIIENINKLLMIKADLQQYQFCEDTYTSDFNNFLNIYGYNPTSLEYEPKSIKAQSIWLYIQGISYYIQQDYNTSLCYNSKLYELYQKHTKFFSRFDYLQLMCNYMYCCCLTQNEEIFNKLTFEYKNIPNQTKEESIFINLYCYCRKLELFHRLSKFKEASQIAVDAEQYFEQIKFNVAHIDIVTIHFNIIRAYIENENYETALKFFQKKFKTISDNYYVSLFKLFEFIIHYKLNNINNLIYYVDSWAKTIRSKRKQFPIEKVLIKFFHSVCNKVTIDEKKKIILSTIEKLKEIENSKQKYYINHYFDFAAWFERELEEMK